MNVKLNIYALILLISVALTIAVVLSVTIFNKNLPGGSPSNLSNHGKAPDIQGISAWVNTPQPLNFTSLKGKIVLVDFWTYSCVNCVRAISHVEAWYNTYGKYGFVVIGVHTPEFPFEHNITNVEEAIQQLNITYPVAIDNNYTTWNAYGNKYWPADYLVDQNGNVRFIQLGEGNYAQTEDAIRSLLLSLGHTTQLNLTNDSTGVNFASIGSPEMYLGYAEIQGHGSNISSEDSIVPNNVVTYTISSVLGLSQHNVIHLYGSWYDAPDSIIAVNNSKLFLTYDAKKAYIVASGNQSVIAVKLDGENVSQQYLGSDVYIQLLNGSTTATISTPRLYNIISSPSYGAWHTLEIDASKGFRLYSFTFG